MGKLTAAIRVADEVWIATALLHREHPSAVDFSLKDIQNRVAREHLAEPRPGIAAHISVHCVANRRPDHGRYRMLFETGPSRRRLFRPGDPYHPKREGGKMLPDSEDIPGKYLELIEWYRRVWAHDRDGDPLLALAVRHRDVWKKIDADDYVRRLREGFE